MPAYDRYHFAVVRALERENWVIVTDLHHVLIGNRYLYPDIFAEQDGATTIVVEVKSFERRSQIDALAEALGKIMLYRAVLAELAMDELPLYLAVPVQASTGILAEPIGELVLESYSIPVIIVDVVAERIVEWLP